MVIVGAGASGMTVAAHLAEAGHDVIVLEEGRNRQIRRMFESVGHRVIRLRRVAVGDLKLGHLKAGEWRFLKAFEVERLLREAGMGSRAD